MSALHWGLLVRAQISFLTYKRERAALPLWLFDFIPMLKEVSLVRVIFYANSLQQEDPHRGHCASHEVWSTSPLEFSLWSKKQLD